jgi:ABC-type dipeptide/oligopeptide/nickel transport system ATPase component
MSESADNRLEISGLTIAFHTHDGVVPAVNDVSFVVPVRKTVALLGESGCGKSVTGRAVMNFIEPPPEKLAAMEEVRKDRFNVRQLRTLVDEL